MTRFEHMKAPLPESAERWDHSVMISEVESKLKKHIFNFPLSLNVSLHILQGMTIWKDEIGE